MTTTDTDTTALILAGEGYQLTIAPEAEARKLELLKAAAAVTTVTTNDESADAQVQSRRLAQMRIEVEKSRKLVKEPVNRIGKLIDSTAKNFLDSLEAEEKRITRLVGDHAAEVAEQQRQRAIDERRAFEEARAAREAAEAAVVAAETTGKISDIIAAKQAERERAEALAARMEASADLSATKVAEGVRFAWDFEVEDLVLLAEAGWQRLVTIEPRRAAILAEIKQWADEGKNVDSIAATIGIRAFKKPVVSSR
jgi:hypothetical protein